jgi:hypothetical protein
MTNRWPHTGAFVVQFPEGAGLDTTPFEGRIEHVASGRAGLFHTLEDLRSFLARVLADVWPDAPGAPDSPDLPERQWTAG